MTKDEIQRKLYMNEIKTKLLAVAFWLLDDDQYSRKDATEDLLKVVAEMDEGGETEIVIPKTLSRDLVALAEVRKI